MRLIQKYVQVETFFILIISFLSCTSYLNSVEIISPNKLLSLEIKVDENEHNSIIYSVRSYNTQIIKNSYLGLILNDNISLDKNWEITSVITKNVKKIWKPVYGERSEIPDNYQEAVVSFRQKRAVFYELILTARVYNEGIAFRYTIPEQNGFINVEISKEKTEFSFHDDFKTWVAYRAQAQYSETTLSNISAGCERPLIIQISDSLYVALGEAALINSARMKFDKSENKPNTLITKLASAVKIDLPFDSPWRYVMVAKSPGELLENNYFILNLNQPCKIEDTSWIKPGKIIREVTLTTQGGIACVDFAVRHNIQYVEFDAGWYGPEYDSSSDALTVTVDPKRSKGPLDLHKVIDYAHQKNIGIILYVNRRALEQQLDEILPLYKSWGIKGIKYGFVQVGSQKWTSWLHDAIIKAAENNLMVDVHDEYRPTGFSRTYPNLMTQEGIRGDEESPTNEHTLITLFTRMIAGAGDNTNCYFAERVDEKMGSHASQMAKAICLYSPWQFLYWYDRPADSPAKRGGAGNNERFILELPELKFFDRLPTVWDDTKVLEGEIGKYTTIARKSGDSWFIGSLTGDPREVIIQLHILEANVDYRATFYFDDEKVNTETKVGVKQETVNSDSILKFKLKRRNGLTIILDKI